MILISRAELFEIGRRALAATPGIRLNPAVANIPGSDLNVVIGMFSVMSENAAARGAKGQRGAFATLARGAQLDRVIYDRSGLLRFGATPSQVDLLLARPAPGGATPGTFAAQSVVQTPDGTQFALKTSATFGDFTTSVTVSAQALVSGLAGNVAAGTIRSFATTPFDATLTVTNPAPAAGGLDREEDIQFLGRYLAYFPTLSKGTMGAIEFGAIQVPGIAVATASEVLNPTSGFPAALVQLVIGDVNGNATLAMVQAVSDKLLEYRALGIPVQVLTGVVDYQAVQWAPAFLTGVDEQLARDRLRAVTVAVSQFLPPGPDRGVLYKAKLITAAQQVPGVIIRESSLLYPLGDVVPDEANHMIRILPTQVSFA